MAAARRSMSSRQRTPLGIRHAENCAAEAAWDSECKAELAKVKGWMEEERANRDEMHTEQRQFLQDLHGLATQIESRLCHVEQQTTNRCVELIGPAVQELGLTLAEVE